jgi:AAA family ATP:ADP antiporter
MGRALAAALEGFLRVRPAETGRMSLSFAHIFLVVAAIALLKPLRNALYIEAFGVGGLPWAFIGVAAVSSLFVWAYARLSDRTGSRVLVPGGLGLGAAGLIGFRFLLDAPAGSLLHNASAAALYVAGAVFAVISASQVWLLANSAFDAREARRVFGVLAAGGILGGIAGGYLASYLASRWGGLSILPAGSLLLAGAAAAADALWKRSLALPARASAGSGSREPSIGRGDRLRDLWSAVLRSPHASGLALMVGIATLAGCLAEFQFSSLAAASIDDGDRLTSFFGFWLSNLSVFSLVLQLILTNSLLRSRGIKASLLVLPAVVAAGSLAVLAWPALWAGTLLKAGEGALKNSLNKSATELLFIPLPGRMRGKAKIFIDVFADNLATGLGGLLLLALSLGPGHSPRLVSLLLLALAAAWIPVLLRVHREYVNSLRRGMERRSLALSGEPLPTGEAALLGSLAGALRSDNPRQIRYALDCLETVRADRFLPDFRRLLAHPETSVRARVMQLLRRGGYAGFAEECRELVRGSADAGERMAALRYLLGSGQDPVSSVFPYLMGEDPSLKEAAVDALCREARRRPELAARVDWEALLEGLDAAGTAAAAPGRPRRIIRARLLGASRSPSRLPELLQLLADPDLEVRKAALAAAGDAVAVDSDLVPGLLPHLAAQPTRLAARDSILSRGEAAVRPLLDALEARVIPLPVLRHLPGILGQLGNQAAVAGLVRCLDAADPTLRFEIIKALNKARRASPRLRLSADALEKALRREALGYLELNALYCRTDQAVLAASDAPFGPADPSISDREAGLLRAAMVERLQRTLERIFRLLSLRFEVPDFHRAYEGIVSGGPGMRANAVELLDNLLPARWKGLLMPLVEGESPGRLFAMTRHLLPADAPAWPDCLARLVETQDDWIKTLALHILGKAGDPRHMGLILSHLNAPDPRVRDAAVRAGSRFSTSPSAEAAK